MHGNCVQCFILQTKWRVLFNRSSMFRKISISKQSISFKLAFMFVHRWPRPQAQCELNKLQKLQNRAARVLTSSTFDTRTEYLFQVLSWRKLESQRQIQKACMVYKSLNGLAPVYLRSRFVERSAVTDYSLHNTKEKLAVPLPRTNFLKNSFRYSGAVLWNSLPTHVRKARTLESFHAGCSGFF